MTLLIISSRENFVICLDYETGAIRWILGDETKKWFTFPLSPNSPSLCLRTACPPSGNMLFP